MLRVRGAPAIGIAAAYGVCVGRANASPGRTKRPSSAAWTKWPTIWPRSRPTAVNLFWALERMKARRRTLRGTPAGEIAAACLAEARAIHEEDRQMCRAIGRHGAELLADGQGVLTHCNAGGLATADYGTALAVFFAAAEPGKRLHVYADETRPLLQGARLTAWELQQRGHRRDADLRFDGRPGDARGPRAGGRHRRRPHRRQRRHGQQDRHLRRGRAGRRPRDSVLRRRAHAARSTCRSRAARKFPSSSATPARSRTASAARPRRTASTSTIRPST